MHVINKLFDLLMLPFLRVSPWPGMLFLSALTGVLLLLLFKVASNQEAVRRRKNRAIARVLELVLFQDDIVVNMGAFVRTIGANLAYLGTLLIPLTASLIPMVLILAQVHAFYGGRPLQTGEETMLSIVYRDKLDATAKPVSLEPAEGIAVVTPAMRSTELGETAWRLRTAANADGQQMVMIRVGDAQETIHVATGTRVARLPFRRSASFWERILYPSGAPLAKNSPLIGTRISYPAADLRLFGIECNWLILFLVLSIVAGLLVKKPLGVEI